MLFSIKEKWFLSSLAVLAIVSVAYYMKYSPQAFPQYGVEFNLTKEDALVKSQQFLEKDLGISTSEYKNVTVLTSTQEQDDANTYLDRELGAEKTGVLANNDVNLWAFSSRFFKPLQQEEYYVDFLPNGRFAGFKKVIPESDAGATLTERDAREVADKFIASATQYSLNDWHEVDYKTEVRPARLDHVFVFEKNDWKAKDATYRMEIDVYGNEVGKYMEFLKVPEAWVLDWETQRSQNDLAKMIADVLMYSLIAASLVIFVQLYKRRALRLRIGLWAGLVVFLVSCLEVASNFSQIVYGGYDTAVTYTSFIMQLIVGALFNGLALGGNDISGALSVFFIVVAGEALYREVFPLHISIEKSIRHGFSSKHVSKALFIGACIGIVDVSFQILYYIIGKKIGIWAPSHVNLSSALSDTLPWVIGLSAGIMGALPEEALFRMFGISFLKKYTGYTWIAAVFISILFGFIHSNYPQMPWFARGLEIGIPAVIWAIVFIRYGFFASFAIHYTSNALGTAFLLIMMKASAYATVSSIFVGLLPLLIAVTIWVLAWRRGGFEKNEEAWNNASVTETLVHENESIEADLQQKKDTPLFEENHTKSYKPLSHVARNSLIMSAFAGLFIGLFLHNKITLQETLYPLTRQEISIKAKESLAYKGVDVDSYHEVTFKNVDSFDSTAEDYNRPQPTMDYILQQSDFSTLKYAQERALFSGWQVRFFKPLEKEEYVVSLLPDGRVYDIAHTVDEKAVGASLSEQDALMVVNQYLNQARGMDMTHYAVVNQEAQQKDNRIDYHFVFEEKDAKIGEATYRTEINLTGNEPGFLHTTVKIPEEWLRNREAIGTKELLMSLFLTIILALIGVLGLREFLHSYRAGNVNFRLAKKVAFVLIGLSVLGILNELPVLYVGYDASTPFLTYALEYLMWVLVQNIGWFCIVLCLVGFISALWKEYTKNVFFGTVKVKYEMYKDAIVSGYAIPVILYGITTGVTFILIQKNWLNATMFKSLLDGMFNIATALPVVTSLDMIATFVVYKVALFIVACAVIYKYCRKNLLIVMLFYAVVSIVLIFSEQTKIDMWLSLWDSFLWGAIAIFVINFAMRNNALAYVVAVLVSLCLAIGMQFIIQPNTFLCFNGMILIEIALLPLFSFLYWYRKNKLEIRGE